MSIAMITERLLEAIALIVSDVLAGDYVSKE
jgi:hypothetical protein